MPMTFVYHPEYSPVQAFSNRRDISIPSGTTIVQGIYYSWDSSGFTGRGWHEELSGSPIAIFDFVDAGYSSVEDYVAGVGHLNDVFAYWSQHYDLDDWDAFYNAVGTDSGCMDVVRPT